MKTVEYPIGKRSAKLRGMIHEVVKEGFWYRRRPAILLLAGGGYRLRSRREEDPVALPLLAMGYQVFILDYSICEDIAFSQPEEEIAEAVALLKEKSEELLVEEDKIAVMGFSAGGHAVASLGCHWKKYGEKSRPDCLILCYPVISMKDGTHEGTRGWIAGEDEEKRAYFSLETQVTPDTVPCFLWHTTEDTSVPVRFTLDYLVALEKNGVDYEAHIFQKGSHGMGTGRAEIGSLDPVISQWMGLLEAWLRQRWGFVA